MTAQTAGSVYDETYRYYLERLQKMRFDGQADLLGIALDGAEVVVPYFGTFVRLTPEGLRDAAGRRPDFADCVVVCRYLIMCPRFEPREKEWAAYRDLPDAGPLTVFWADTVENQLAKRFTGDVAALRKACDALEAVETDLEITCDLCRRFLPLPKVPLLLAFNDGDDDFPAAASLLFEKRASTYLDAESQAILGHILTQRLTRAAAPQ